MNGISTIVIVAIFSIIADVVLKKSSENNNMFLLGLGIFLYMIDAVLWFLAYKYSKFSTVGVIYSILMIIISIIVGIMFFKEKIELKEMFGIGLGIISLFLLAGK